MDLSGASYLTSAPVIIRTLSPHLTLTSESSSDSACKLLTSAGFKFHPIVTFTTAARAYGSLRM